jgi:hypothetical protein
MEGLEPPHLTASDPKSDVSTNFTTSGENFIRRGGSLFNRDRMLQLLNKFPASWVQNAGIFKRVANVCHFKQRKRPVFRKFVDNGNC